MKNQSQMIWLEFAVLLMKARSNGGSQSINFFCFMFVRQGMREVLKRRHFTKEFQKRSSVKGNKDA